MTKQAIINGVIHEFPDDATHEEMEAATAHIPNESIPAPKNNFYGTGETNTLNSIADSPAVNATLGFGDALRNMLSAGHLNQPSSSGMAYQGGSLAGNILPMMMGEGLVAKGLGKVASGLSPLMNRILASGLTSGAQSALMSPDHRLEALGLGTGAGAAITPLTSLASKLSPLLGMPIRAGLGAALGYHMGGAPGAEAGGLAGAVAPYAIPSLAKNLARNVATEHVDLAAAAPKLEAARRLGLSYLTPAEATASPFVGAFQGSVGKTGEGSNVMYEKSQERLGSERNAIKDLFSTIYDKEKLDPVKSAAYESSLQTQVHPDVLDSLTESNIVQNAMKKVDNDPVYQDKLKNVPKTSFAYLDQVKRALNDMSEVAKRTGEKDKARLIGQQTSELTDKMDQLSPEYANARALAQRDIVSNKMQTALNDKDIRGTNFYNKFLKNDNTFNKLRSSLSNVPEAQKKLDDMKMVFGDLINPQTARTAAALSKTGMTQGRNPFNAIGDMIKNFNGGNYDKAAIKLITDPKWDSEFKNIMDMKDKNSRSFRFANFLSKLSSSGIANALNAQGNQENGY